MQVVLLQYGQNFGSRLWPDSQHHVKHVGLFAQKIRKLNDLFACVIFRQTQLRRIRNHVIYLWNILKNCKKMRA